MNCSVTILDHLNDLVYFYLYIVSYDNFYVLAVICTTTCAVRYVYMCTAYLDVYNSLGRCAHTDSCCTHNLLQSPSE